MRVMISDCETGGLDANSHSLLSVAVAVVDLDAPKFSLLESWEAYHRLPKIENYKVTAKALEINGLDVETVHREGIPSEELSAKMVDTFHRHGCVACGGQNWGFDKKFFARRLFRVSDDEFENIFSHDGRFNVLDTLHIARLLTDTLPVKKMNLANLVTAFNVDISDLKGGYHGALFDTIATARLLYAQKQLFKTGWQAVLSGA